jgi:hypothetical protein
VSTGSTLGLPISGLTHRWTRAPTVVGLAETGAACKSARVVGESSCHGEASTGLPQGAGGKASRLTAIGHCPAEPYAELRPVPDGRTTRPTAAPAHA